MRHRWLLVAAALLGAVAAVVYVLWPQPPLQPTGYSYHLRGGFAGFDLLLTVEADGSWTYRDARDPGRHTQGWLTREQLDALTRLAQEVDWPHLPAAFPSQPAPADELFRTVEVRTPGRTYRVTVGSVAPIPETLTSLLNFLEGVRRDAEAALPPRFALVVEGRALYLADGSGEKKKLVDLDQLPATFRPRGAEAEFGVGRDGFGPCALSPGGTRVAWSTVGLHPVVGYLNLRQPQPVTLDLFFEGGVGALAWSPRDAYLAVQVQSPAGGTTLAVYDVGRAAALPFPAREEFPPSAYEISLSGWRDEHTLAFRVQSIPGQPPPVAPDWTWDVRKGEVTRGTP